MKSPRTTAIAFRIWQYCTHRGWDCTAAEVAEALGDVGASSVARICHRSGWSGRLRVAITDSDPRAFRWTGGTSDAFLSGQSGRDIIRQFSALTHEAAE